MKNFLKKAALFTFLTAGAVFGLNNAQAQQVSQNKSTLGDIIENGYGNFFVKDAQTLNPLPNVEITSTAIYIPGNDSIPDDYILTTNSSGVAPFEFLTFAELGVGLSEMNTYLGEFKGPNPSTDFTIAYKTNSANVPAGTLLDMQGRIIGEVQPEIEGNKAIFYTDLQDQANGMYLLQTIVDGQQHVDKLMKIQGRKVGKQSTPEFKEGAASLEDAIYQITVSHEGYEFYQEEVAIHTGDNGWLGIDLIPGPGIPQNQDLIGQSLDVNNGFSPLPGTIVYANINGDITEQVVDENGYYVVEDVPTNTTVGIAFANPEGIDKFDLDYSYYTTPTQITNPSDTVKVGFNAPMADKIGGLTAYDVFAHINHGTILGDEVPYNLNGVINPIRKQDIRNGIQIAYNYEGGSTTYVEQDEECTDYGINFADGDNQTTTHSAPRATNWNHTLYPTSGGNTTISTTEDEKVVIHELYLSLGHLVTARYCIMQDVAPEYITSDSTLRNFSKVFYDGAYQYEYHGIGADKLEDQLDTEITEPAVQIPNNVHNYYLIIGLRKE